MNLTINILNLITMQTNQLTNRDDQKFDKTQIVQQNHIKSKTNPEEMTEMLIKYVMQTYFIQYLRNNYHFFHQFTKKDLKFLFKTGQIFRVKKAHSNMIINFNQPTVCILVFGSVSLEGKLYAKGEFFVAINDRIEMFFSNKTTLAMLHKQDLQNKLYELQNYYFKKKQIEKILPLDLLLLNKNQIQRLIKVSESLESSVTDKVLNKSSDKNKGVYLLYQGVYSMKSSEDIPFTQITCDYFGEQILWSESYEFSIQANTCPFRFIFLLKEDILQILNSQNIEILNQIYNKKIEIRKKMVKQVENNLEFTKKMIKKMEISYKNHSKTDYKQFKGKVCRNPINKQWIIQKTRQGRLKVAHCSPKIDNEMSSPQTVQIEEMDEFNDSRQNSNLNFSKTIYKSQKAQSERLFRKRVQTQGNQKFQIHSKKRSQLSENGKQKKTKYLTEKSELDALPKTLSVLLKYYESNKKIKAETLDLKQKDTRVFLASAKSRRLATNLKLHQQIFYKEFLEIRNEQNRAFKTWR